MWCAAVRLCVWYSASRCVLACTLCRLCVRVWVVGGTAFWTYFVYDCAARVTGVYVCGAVSGARPHIPDGERAWRACLTTLVCLREVAWAAEQLRPPPARERGACCAAARYCATMEEPCGRARCSERHMACGPGGGSRYTQRRREPETAIGVRDGTSSAAPKNGREHRSRRLSARA